MISAAAVHYTRKIVFPLLLLFLVGAVDAEPAIPEGVEAKQESSLVGDARGYGRKMGKAEAAALEQALKAKPDDLPARAKLLGYYFYQGLKQEGAVATKRARRRHITWLIRNHPDSRLGGLPEATIDPAGHPMADKGGYETASAMWRALADRDDAARQTLENAFNFLRLHDKAEAEKIAKRANDPYLLGQIYAMGVVRVSMMNQNGLVMAIGSSKEDEAYAEHAVEALRATDDKRVLDMAASFLLMRGSMVQVMAKKTGQVLEPEPVAFAGELVERCEDCQSQGLYYKIMGMMSRSPEEQKKLAQKELALLEKKSSLRSQEMSGKGSEIYVMELTELAKVAFSAGEYEKATNYANELLSRLRASPDDDLGGESVHSAHIVLGRIALLKGDAKTAGQHLLDAADVKGGAVLKSFGPNMALAKELLEHGERDVVIAYLKRCERFWSRGQNRLNEWITTIKKGGTPNFGPNLVY